MASDRAERALLSAESLCKVYRMGEVDVHALRDVTLDVREGEILLVVGPSGSGKSTLLNLIGGMDRPTSGSVVFHGRKDDGEFANGGWDLTHASDRELTRYRRSQVGFVFQFFNLVPTLTARENVEVAVEIATAPLDPLDALDMVGLADRADHFPSQLSGGQQQRVAIARALASNPPLLLCDELTGALDSETGRQLLGILCDLNDRRGQTIVIITHNHAIATVGHRVAEIRDGRIAKLETNSQRVPPSEIQW